MDAEEAKYVALEGSWLCEAESTALHLDAEEANHIALEATWLSEAARWSLWTHVGRMMTEEKISAWEFSDSWQLIMQVLKLVFGTLFVNHLVCCLWFVIGRHGPTNTGASCITSGEFSSVPFIELDRGYKWLTSFHFTSAQITHGSYFNIAPMNTLERLFDLLLLYVSLLFSSIVICMFSATTMQRIWHMDSEHETCDSMEQNKDRVFPLTFSTEFTIKSNPVVYYARSYQEQILESVPPDA